MVIYPQISRIYTDNLVASNSYHQTSLQKTPKESKICENLWETIINPLKSIESNEESKKNRFDRGTLQCHTY